MPPHFIIRLARDSRVDTAFSTRNVQVRDHFGLRAALRLNIGLIARVLELGELVLLHAHGEEEDDDNGDEEDSDEKEEDAVPPADDQRGAPGREQEDKSWKKRFEDLQARYEKTIANMDDGSDKSSITSASGKKKKRSDRRKEAEKVGFPDLPSVPRYAAWLEQVMRLVMDGSGSPLEALIWWSEIGKKTVEELANSGPIFVRWDLKIGTGLLKRASGHLRRDLFLRQLKADPATDILRGRQIMKLIMQKYKAEDHAQRYYDIQDLEVVSCLKDDIVGFLLRWDTVFLRMMPEAQAALGERALLYMFHEQIKDSVKLKCEMHLFKTTKSKDPNYERIRTLDWLRAQTNDHEAEMVRIAVREGAAEGVAKGTNVPGGEGSGLKHLAAPATVGEQMSKDQKKQSAGDKALHKAGLEAQAAGVRSPQGKAKSKAKSSNRTKPPAPHGTCFEYWEHGKCSVRSSGATCKWEHVKANSPEAKAYMAKAKIAAAEKEKRQTRLAGMPQTSKKKASPVSTSSLENARRVNHANIPMPATLPPLRLILRISRKGHRARKATTYAAPVEEVNAVAGAGPTFAGNSSDSFFTRRNSGSLLGSP